MPELLCILYLFLILRLSIRTWGYFRPEYVRHRNVSVSVEPGRYMLYLYLAISESVAKQSFSSRGRRCLEAGVLCQSCHEWPLDQVPKYREASVGSLHHLEEAQPLLKNLPDHNPY